MTHSSIPGSFRDPSGFVFTRGDELYRQVNQRYKHHYDFLLNSGLYETLVAQRLLVPHREVDVEPDDPTTASVVLHPEPIRFVSYPYEWSFSQLRDAALLTLKVQEVALEHEMSLHDASAYNVQFRGGRPVLIDTLSFERIREGQPWLAYGQFCRHFLAPLALMAHRDSRLGALLRIHIDGIPLDLTDRLLPRRARYRPSLFLHLHAHARHHADEPKLTSSRPFTRRAFQGLVESLCAAIRRLKPNNRSTRWLDYYAEADHYSNEAVRHKKACVETAIDHIGPRTVWDLGANTGLFGRVAADRGIPTVCFDVDHDSVDANYRRAVEDGEENLLPLLCDLTNPSPSLGWAHTERLSMIERGPADLVLALALVHHLAIGNNVPLEQIAHFLHLIGRWILVEFVPKEDPKVQTLLSVRDDIFDDYNESGFEQAFGRWFEVVHTTPIQGSGRSLYLMHSRDARPSETG